MKLPKITNREWIFLGGGIVLGYFLIPRIFHHDTTPTTIRGQCTNQCLGGKDACHGTCIDSGCGNILTCDVQGNVTPGQQLAQALAELQSKG